MADGKGRAAVDLKRVLREVRIGRAEQNDVIVDLREADQMRLELLGEALEGVVQDLPKDNEQLLLGLLPGQPPRYWVDATSFGMMGRDRRQYQFVKDTRLGRTVLAEGTDVAAIAAAVTRYVAERIVEREQAMEGDRLSAVIRGGVQRSSSSAENLNLVWGLCGFGLGAISGMFLLVAYAWFATG